MLAYAQYPKCVADGTVISHMATVGAVALTDR